MCDKLHDTPMPVLQYTPTGPNNGVFVAVVNNHVDTACAAWLWGRAAARPSP